MSDAPLQITLRGLPLPAKFVLSCFLISVGMGYLSAMVQLHLQHSDRDGSALPTVDNVIERFSGLKKPRPGEQPKSKMELLVLGDPAGDLTKENMAPAFFAKSNGYEKDCNERSKATVDAEREGERKVVLAWLRTTLEVKQSSYAADAFDLPAALKDQPLTGKFSTGDKVAIKSLIDARCARCHKEGDQDPDLTTFDNLAGLITPPKQELLPGGYVRSAKQMSIEGLTQSTHAHLLSFAMLFTLTGLTFALSSYPVLIRCVLGPIVLLAQVADVACWWLARIPDVGPLFASAILGTGTIVGIGLVLQIVLSLFNMYGSFGKLVVLLLLVGGAIGLGYVGISIIEPALAAERATNKLTQDKPADATAVAPKPKAVAKKDEVSPAPVKPEVKPAKAPETKPTVKPEAPVARPSQLELLVAGPRKVMEGVKFDGTGTMAPAFFEKSEGYRSEAKERGAEVVDREREMERQVVLAWIKLQEKDRKQSYEKDLFALPGEMVSQLTEAYRSTDKKAAKIQSILNDRCVRCHMKGEAQEDYPLENYEQILKYLAPGK